MTLSIGGTSETIRGYGFEKHQHHLSHDKDTPGIIHTTTSTSVLVPAESQHIKLRTGMHSQHPIHSLQYQHLKTYNSVIAKKHHDLAVASPFSPYKRWDELTYEKVDEKFRYTYTRDYVYQVRMVEPHFMSLRTRRSLNYYWKPRSPNVRS